MIKKQMKLKIKSEKVLDLADTKKKLATNLH